MPTNSTSPIKARCIFGPSSGREYATLPLGLYIVSEGFPDEFAFQIACSTLLKDLRRISPFSSLKEDSPFAIYTCYSESKPIQVGTDPYTAGSSNASGMDVYYKVQRTTVTGTRGCELFLDYKKMVNVCKRVRIFSEVQNTDLPLVLSATIPDPSQSPDADIASSYQYPPGAILVLTPKLIFDLTLVPPNGLLSASDPIELELEHTPTTNEPLHFAVTSANENYARVAARMLGLALGLGDEFEDKSGSPPPNETVSIGLIPNLIYASSHAELEASLSNNTFKWAAVNSMPLLIIPNYKNGSVIDQESGSLVSNAGISLWEGGGGYSNDVYRAAHDCIMRQKPGMGTIRMKASQQPFCKVCWVHITKAINGEYSLSRVADQVTLSTQKNEYSKIQWDKTEQLKNNNSKLINLIVDHNDISFNYFEYIMALKPEAFWGFTCFVNPIDGFLIKNVNVHQPKYYDKNKDLAISLKTDFKTVFDSISFENIKVEFDGVNRLNNFAFYDFDIKDYIKKNKFVLNRSYHGYTGSGYKAMYQNGLELVIIEDNPSLPHMELTLSCVMRAPADDFDPGGAAEALKIYPQIQFKWKKRNSLNLSVTKFHGTVKTITNVKHHMYNDPDVNDPNKNRFTGMKMEPGTQMEMNESDISCFTDNNSTQFGGSILRRSDIETVPLLSNPDFPAVLKPTWALIFDYYDPHVVNNNTAEKDFVAVYGPEDLQMYSTVRKLYKKNLIEGNSTYNDIFISKFPRQGAYDNMHVTGAMGKHNSFKNDNRFNVIEIEDEEVVAAPFCGVDCFHLHWRWSILSDFIARKYIPHDNPRAVSFRGWSRHNPQSHKIIGAPLIPPNQKLRIRLAAKERTEPKKNKIIEYSVTVINPAPDENQVIFEQGMGWAMVYGSGALFAKLAILLAPPFPVPSLYFTSSGMEESFSYIYDFIRFHHKYINDTIFPIPKFYADRMEMYNHTQVPKGSEKPTPAWPTHDMWVNLYKVFATSQEEQASEEYYNQTVIDESTPSLTIKSIEEL